MLNSEVKSSKSFRIIWIIGKLQDVLSLTTYNRKLTFLLPQENNNEGIYNYSCGI